MINRDALQDAWPVPGPWTLTPAPTGINNLTRLVETPAGAYVLRLYRPSADPRKVSFEVQVLEALGEARLPFAVPVPLKARSGERVVKATGPDGQEALATLMAAIPGEHPPLEDLPLAREAGRILGVLHGALDAIVLRPDPTVIGTYGDLHRVSTAMPDPVS